jgi:hypothetical protein
MMNSFNRWTLLRKARRLLGAGGDPDFFIIGAQKSGTTSLYSHLVQHPNVILRVNKEVHFWSRNRNCEKGMAWYRSHFPSGIEKKVRSGFQSGKVLSGEGTTVMSLPNAPSRIRDQYPALKLIAILRDPVQRAFSHYRHVRRTHPEQEPLPFEEAIQQEDRDYKSRGRYAEQLQRWFSLFGRDQVLVSSFERFVEKPQEATDKCFRFLNLSAFQVEARHYNRDQSNEEMSPATEEYLREFFRPHNQKLYDLLGQDMGWPA